MTILTKNRMAIMRSVIASRKRKILEAINRNVKLLPESEKYPGTSVFKIPEKVASWAEIPGPLPSPGKALLIKKYIIMFPRSIMILAIGNIRHIANM